MEPGSAKWRIDTLDARGGLAFASWREADLEEGARLFDRPVFHFSPQPSLQFLLLAQRPH